MVGHNLHDSLSDRGEEGNVQGAASELLERRGPSIREVAGLVGLMTAYSPAIEFGGAHIKRLEMDKNEALAYRKGNFDGKITPSRGAKDILWWVNNLDSKRAIKILAPDLEICTDASGEGWGAHRGEVTAVGRWTLNEKQSHINVLELKAVLFGLQSLYDSEKVHVQVYSDNTTAMAYIKHMGGVKSRERNRVAR